MGDGVTRSAIQQRRARQEHQDETRDQREPPWAHDIDPPAGCRDGRREHDPCPNGVRQVGRGRVGIAGSRVTQARLELAVAHLTQLSH